MVCSPPAPVDAEGTKNSAAADESDFLQQYAETYRFTHGRPAGVRVAPTGDAVLFLRSEPRSFVRQLYEFDVATGKERLLLTADELLRGKDEKLTAEELARRERMRSAARGIASFDLSDNGRRILVPLSGDLYVVDRTSHKVTKLAGVAKDSIDARFSPSAQRVAYVSGGELYVHDVEASTPVRLTSNASETLSHGLAEFVAQEEMNRMHGYWWSPDEKHLLYQETDTSSVELLHIADPARPERPAETWRYPRPGKNNARVRLGIVATAGGETKWIDWDAARWPYLATAAWEKNAPPTILVQNREQTEEVLSRVDPQTGRTSEILRETDDAWVNIDDGMPRWLSDGLSFLWSSERSGAWQLELRGAEGRLIRTLAGAEQGYRGGVLGVDESRQQVYFAGGHNPTELHVYRVHYAKDGAEPEQLTRDKGLHTATFSKQGGVSVRTFSGLDGTSRQTVHRADGSLAGELQSVAEEPPFLPNLELVTVGEMPWFHAAIVRPRDFKAGQRYPVLVSVYGGPHSQTVTASRNRYLLHQWFADRGFVVVSIDGRGTPSRGRAWERAIKGNLIQTPLEDQVRGLQALGAKYPELDLSRVGIFGWSFGGYFSAIATMHRPDVFHAGVAGAPVADWLDYDTHYTERYMGLPEKNVDGYKAASALNFAGELKRPLLIIHGTADDNVYFLHSVKLSDALFRAGKPHEFLPLAGYTHMVPDPLVTRRLNERIAEFFQQSLKPAETKSASAGR